MSDGDKTEVRVLSLNLKSPAKQQGGWVRAKDLTQEELVHLVPEGLLSWQQDITPQTAPLPEHKCQVCGAELEILKEFVPTGETHKTQRVGGSATEEDPIYTPRNTTRCSSCHLVYSL